jgi:hypothetical protein
MEPVGGFDREQWAASIHLAANVVAAQLALDGYGNFKVDMTISSVEINVCCQFRRDSQRNAPIARTQVPPVAHGGPAFRIHFDSAVASVQIKQIEASPRADVPVCLYGLEWCH